MRRNVPELLPLLSWCRERRAVNCVIYELSHMHQVWIGGSSPAWCHLIWRMESLPAQTIASHAKGTCILQICPCLPHKHVLSSDEPGERGREKKKKTLSSVQSQRSSSYDSFVLVGQRHLWLTSRLVSILLTRARLESSSSVPHAKVCFMAFFCVIFTRIRSWRYRAAFSRKKPE